jgi:nitrite reductase (NADH) small subunit
MSGASGFMPVCRVSEIPRLGARVLARAANEGCDVAVFRTADDQVFAIDDRCPHKGGPLSQGIVHGDRVSCPLHGWNIALDSGRAIAPDEGCAARHEVRIDDGWVMIRLDAAPATV